MNRALNALRRSSRKHLTRRLDRRNFQVEALEPRELLAVVISEFQASNDTTLADRDGDFSDWIELHNTSLVAEDITGWHLTDDDTNLSKWTFPATTLDPDEFLVVFASEKDPVAGSDELHTNFKLNAGGEYLALVQPDGMTIASEYAPEYPSQFTDQSYGLAVGRDTSVLFDGGPVSTYVPTDDSLGVTWTEPGFNDAGWASGTTAIGYERLAEGLTESDDFTAPLGADWTVDLPDGIAVTATVSGGDLRVSLPAANTLNDPPLVTRAVPPLNSDFSIETSVDVASGSGHSGLAVVDGITGDVAISLEFDNTNSVVQFIETYAADSIMGSGARVGISGVILRLEYDVFADSWSSMFRVNPGDSWSQISVLTEGINGVPQVSDPQVGLLTKSTAPLVAEYDYFELDVSSEPEVYTPKTGLNVETDMFDQSASIYARIPFSVAGDPSRFDELSLALNYDDGVIAYINGVEVARRNVALDATWNSTADVAFGAVNGNIPVEVINLNGRVGLLQSGNNVLSLHGLNVAADDADFFLDASLVASDVLDVTPQVFVEPTPGATNNLPAAPTPAYSVAGGTFTGSMEVEISIPDPSPTLQIRYTTDGTDPTAVSTLYTGPITLTSSAELRSRTFDVGATHAYSDSNPASAAYIALHSSLADRDSDIPLLVVDTLGQAFPSAGAANLIPGLVAAIEPDPVTGRANLLNGDIDYTGLGGFRRRGSSTGGNAKPSLKFETWGGFIRDDFNTELLGLPKESDWVLYGPFNFDRALLHEPFIYSMALDMGHYASRTVFIEAYLNTSGSVVDANDYAGVYVLMEQLRQGSGRLDIANDDPSATYSGNLETTPIDDPITGGYLWKIDRTGPGDTQFTGGGASPIWVSPSVATTAQRNYATDYFNAFKAALDGPNAYDPEIGYAKYIDVDSWVDNNLLNVLTMNVDAYRLSGYFYKDRGGKLSQGPLWDFDRALESTDGRDDRPDQWMGGDGLDNGNDDGTDFFGARGDAYGGLWWRQLFQDPNFFQSYIDRYYELRQSFFSHEAIDARIDYWADIVREASQRNDDEQGSVFSPNSQQPRTGGCHGPAPGEPSACDGTWQGEVENMRAWLHRRIDFMDAQFAQAPTMLLNGEPVPATQLGLNVESGAQVALNGTGDVYYTLDGTDPRGPDDLPTASAISFTGSPNVLIDSSSTGTLLVPTGAAAENGWQQVGYDDAAWSPVSSSFGFDEDPSGVTDLGQAGFLVHTIDLTSLPSNVNVATDIFNGVAEFTSTSDEERVDPYLNYGPSNGSFNSPANLTLPGISGSDGIITRATAKVTIPVGTWTIAVSSDDGMRLTIPGVEFTSRQNMNTSSISNLGDHELVWATARSNGGTTFGTFEVTGAPLETSIQLDHFQFLNILSSFFVELSIAEGQMNSFNAANFSILQDGTSGWSVNAAAVTVDLVEYDPLITSDIAAQMHGVSSSAYARYEFDIPGDEDVLDLKAELYYDDGYVIYLNGTKVAEDLAPANPNASSSATGSRLDSEVLTPVMIPLGEHVGLVQSGTNVLAIHALNADDDDLLLSVGLETKTATPIVITENTRIVARNFDTTDRGPYANGTASDAQKATDWSGVETHDFVVTTPQLIISEVQYNPADPTAAELAAGGSLSAGDFEFIEIYNPGAVTMPLTGALLSNGVGFDFAANGVTALGPDEYGLIVANQAAFDVRYGAGLPVLGNFSGSLANGGEALELTDSTGTQLFRVEYNDGDPWAARADGDGASLELIDVNTNAARQNKYYSWQASSTYNGTPGAATSAPVGVVINEVLSRTDDANAGSDTIELLNTTSGTIDIGGWYLSDSGNNPFKFQIPDNTQLAAGDYILFNESDFNADEDGFALNSAEGDDVYLVIANAGGTRVETFVDDVHFGAANDRESFGRVPNGSGRLAPLESTSYGTENGSPRVGPLVISEVNYAPGPPSAAALAADPDILTEDLEFIEVHNPTGTAVDLTDWRIRGNTDFNFDDGTMIAAGESIVVIPFNPDNPVNSDRLSAFAAHYGISLVGENAPQIVGGYDSDLNNNGERLQLQRPDIPPVDQPGLIPRLYEDEVLYDDLAPWAVAADGSGNSLTRISATAYGNSSSSWIAASPTPGSYTPIDGIPGDFNGDTNVDATDIDLLCGGGVANGDLNGDGAVDDGDVQFLVTNILGTEFGDANLNGKVDAVDLNAVGLRWQQSGAGIGWATGDFTCDGTVDAQDLNQIGLHWQFGVAAPARVPRAPLAVRVPVVAATLADAALADIQRPNVGIEKVLAGANKTDSTADSSLRRVRDIRQSNRLRRLSAGDRVQAPNDLPLRATDEWFKRLG